MVQIKGSVIQETINQIKNRAGEDAFQKILALLDEETRNVLKEKSTPLPGTPWIFSLVFWSWKFVCSPTEEKRWSRAARKR